MRPYRMTHISGKWCAIVFYDWDADRYYIIEYYEGWKGTERRARVKCVCWNNCFEAGNFAQLQAWDVLPEPFIERALAELERGE